MKLPAMRDVLARQQELDLFQPLAKAGVRFVGRNAEAAELVRQEGARETDVEPAGPRISRRAWRSRRRA
jgi:hypothetical protein